MQKTAFWGSSISIRSCRHCSAETDSRLCTFRIWSSAEQAGPKSSWASRHALSTCYVIYDIFCTLQGFFQKLGHVLTGPSKSPTTKHYEDAKAAGGVAYDRAGNVRPVTSNFLHLFCGNLCRRMSCLLLWEHLMLSISGH